MFISAGSIISNPSVRSHVGYLLAILLGVLSRQASWWALMFASMQCCCTVSHVLSRLTSASSVNRLLTHLIILFDLALVHALVGCAWGFVSATHSVGSVLGPAGIAEVKALACGSSQRSLRFSCLSGMCPRSSKWCSCGLHMLERVQYRHMYSCVGRSQVSCLVMQLLLALCLQTLVLCLCMLVLWQGRVGGGLLLPDWCRRVS